MTRPRNDMTVRFRPPAGRPRLARQPRLDPAGGAQVPISQVAEIALRTGESSIAHDMGQRMLTVRIDCGIAISSPIWRGRNRDRAGVKLDHSEISTRICRAVREPARAQARLRHLRRRVGD